MEGKYKIFGEEYNDLLDLVEKVDGELAQKYKKTISFFPEVILDKLKTNQEFSCDGAKFHAAMELYENMLTMQYIKYGKYYSAELSIYPFFECDLLDVLDEEDKEANNVENDDKNLFIFSLTLSNTHEQPKISINYEEKDGKYVYVDSLAEGIEFDYEVFVDKRDDEYFLRSVKKFNDLEIYEKVVPISFEELSEFALDDYYLDVGEDDITDCPEDEIDF